MANDYLSLNAARRIALAAQGFDRPRAGRAGIAHVRRTVRQLGLLQLDYVNVLGPAHYQVLFSRLGPYDRGLLDELVYRRREFTEQWAHEASVLPMESWSLLRHRMETFRLRPHGFETFLEQHPDYASQVIEEIRARGPLAASDLAGPVGAARRIPGAWFGTVPRATLEAHFARGRLAVAGRRPNFVREFDLAERIIPPEQHARRVRRDEAERELLRLAARAHGVGTASDLADYYRTPMREARPRLAELVERGDLRPVRVESWTDTAYLHIEASRPRRISAATLLSPFDPVIWNRPRVARLFGFDYRVEIFVPRAKRRWGYYVLPFLMGDRLVARIDLKADRPACRLRVLSAHLEPEEHPAKVARALATELRRLATWSRLETVVVGRRGNLARALAAAVRA